MLSSSAFLFYSGSAPVLRETNCVCDRFQFPCLLGSHISSLRVDSVFVAFSCVETMVWKPMPEIFGLHTDVNACHCTLGMYEHCKRVRTDSWLWEQNSLPYQGVKAAPAVCQTQCLTNYATFLPPVPPPLECCKVLNVSLS